MKIRFYDTSRNVGNFLVEIDSYICPNIRDHVSIEQEEDWFVGSVIRKKFVVPKDEPVIIDVGCVRVT